MIKINASYESIEEKDKLINELKSKFKVVKISKEYGVKGKSPYKKIYMNLSCE